MVRHARPAMLPDHRAAMSEEQADATLEDLLTMTAGYPALVPMPPEVVRSTDPVRAILDLPPGEPGEFVYSNASAHLVAAIVEQAVGEPLLDYARSRLFDPLGIRSRPAHQPTVRSDAPAQLRRYERAGFAWPVDAAGTNVGWGLVKLRPDDMLRLGRTFLDGGRWQGSQVVPQEWVDAATTKRSPVDDVALSGYGYQWWTREVAGVKSFVALGYGGQIIEVIPALDAVVVVASELDLVTGTNLDTGLVLALVEDAVVPALARENSDGETG